jgi:phytoene desaturase
MKENVHIIGSGFSSISAATYLAQAGYDVTVFEKNDQLGGRARQYIIDGFKFDIGPSWYWMPDVFDRFFNDFGKKTADYYSLEKLSPAYRVFFEKGDFIDIDDSINKIVLTFESIEAGSGKKLEKFLKIAKNNYDIAIGNLVYKPGIKASELITKDTILHLKQFYLTVHDYVKKHFKDKRLQQILEFPVLFLGAKPSDTPLFYSFMNYADFGLGTWYPKGGMRAVIEGMIRLSKELGVKYENNSNVSAINISIDNKVESIVINDKTIEVDILLSGADYKHTESLLEIPYRSYSETYWDKRVMAPSSLLFFVGFDKKLENVLHHNLFFDVSFDKHAKEIYDDPSWPEEPLFYANFPSINDSEAAPHGKESGFFLIPLAPDLEDTQEMRDKYFNVIIDRMEKLTKQELRSSILFEQSYCVNDFKEDYNAFKGNAYGMANTLLQTAFLRPGVKSKKIDNLFFTGQLTVPGPGVPPALISGKIVSQQIIKSTAKKSHYEVNV